MHITLYNCTCTNKLFFLFLATFIGCFSISTLWESLHICLPDLLHLHTHISKAFDFVIILNLVLIFTQISTKTIIIKDLTILECCFISQICCQQCFHFNYHSIAFTKPLSIATIILISVSHFSSSAIVSEIFEFLYLLNFSSTHKLNQYIHIFF